MYDGRGHIFPMHFVVVSGNFDSHNQVSCTLLKQTNSDPWFSYSPVISQEKTRPERRLQGPEGVHGTLPNHGTLQSSNKDLVAVRKASDSLPLRICYICHNQTGGNRLTILWRLCIWQHDPSWAYVEHVGWAEHKVTEVNWSLEANGYEPTVLTVEKIASYQTNCNDGGPWYLLCWQDPRAHSVTHCRNQYC